MVLLLYVLAFQVISFCVPIKCSSTPVVVNPDVANTLFGDANMSCVIRNIYYLYH